MHAGIGSDKCSIVDFFSVNAHHKYAMRMTPTDKNQMFPTSSSFISLEVPTRRYILFSTLKVMSIRARNIMELAASIEKSKP